MLLIVLPTLMCALRDRGKVKENIFKSPWMITFPVQIFPFFKVFAEAIKFIFIKTLALKLIIAFLAAPMNHKKRKLSYKNT